MTSEKITLKNFIKNETLLEKKKKKRSKKKKSRKPKGGGIATNWHTSGFDNDSAGDGGGMGESFILELLAGIGPASFSANVHSATAYNKNTNDKDAGMTTYPSENPEAWGTAEEEPEMQVSKVDQARRLFQAMFNRPDASRAEIINSFMKDVGVTNSTAVSYYTRFLEEFGVNSKDDTDNLGQGVDMGGDMDAHAAQGSGDEKLSQPQEEPPEMEEPLDPDRAGIIRTVDNAHLVFKRQSEDGSYEELWIYNLHDSTNDELKIRRAVLSGTDIPPKKTKSADGAQKYTITTLGNAQMMKIVGLPN